MKFNLDIAEAYLAAFDPHSNQPQSSVLHLQTAALTIPQPSRAQTTLAIVDAQSVLATPQEALEQTYLVIADIPDTDTLHALTEYVPDSCHYLMLSAPSNVLEVLEVVLRMIEHITLWSDDFTQALFRHAPLTDIFTCAQRIFTNPLMVSDSSMCYLMHIGALPDDFSDDLWTPAIQTGYCPIENYYTLWSEYNDNPFRATQAFVVPYHAHNHSYLYRNVAAQSSYFGSFELIDVNAPFSARDLSFADYIGDTLAMAFSCHEYDELSQASSNPLYDMMHNKPVRKEMVEFVLSHMGWDMHEPYHVTYFQPTGPLCATKSARTQCRRRIETAYPQALVFDEEDGFCAIKRQVDFPIESALCTSEAVSKLFAAPYEIAMGASSTMTDFSYLPSGLKQAKFALEYAKRERTKPNAPVACLVRFDDCYFDAFIQSFSEHDYHALLSVAPVETLVQSDREAQTEYIKTLVAFFENGFNIHNTADALHIHRNTLTYRLKRIKQFSGIDCETPRLSSVDPLRVYIACRAHLSSITKDS